MTMDAIITLLEMGDDEMGVLYMSTDRVKALEVFLKNMRPMLADATRQTVAGIPRSHVTQWCMRFYDLRPVDMHQYH